MRVAAIDVGTNSIHLLVADVEPDGQLTVVEKDRRQVMLGSGGLDAQHLTDEAQQRGLDALKAFAESAHSLQADTIRAAATSAVREADNGDEFCRRVKAETGVHIRTIAGEDEAELIYLGARPNIDFSRGQVLLFDVGGGSTEFILADRDDMIFARSLRLGHIRLAEAHNGGDIPLTEQAHREIKATVRDKLEPLLRRVPPSEVDSLVGTSGTVRTLARMCTLAGGQKLPAHGQGLVLRRADLEDLLRRMEGADLDTLAALPGMDLRRLRTLPAGAVLVREVMKAFGCEQLTTCDQSLREGLIHDWIRTHKPQLALEAKIADPRRRSVELALKRFERQPEHARQVARLALQLFDGTADLHQLSVADKRMLRDAALLHDIGHHINGKSHPKHAQYLLKHIRMPGFSAPEVAVLSNVVRYHTRSRPKNSHADFSSLPAEDKNRVRALSAFLRVADGLDRSHAQPILWLECEVRDDRIVITAHARTRADQEGWAARRRLEALEELLGRPIELLLTTEPETEEA